MRIVLDTNILVRAVASHTGPARETLLLLQSGPHLLLTSRYILKEIERVLHYPHLQARWQLEPAEITEFVEEIERGAVMVDATSTGDLAVAIADPADEAVLQTAVVGRADVLCTLDRHLREAAVRTYAAERGIEILNDVELLERLRRMDTAA